MNGLLKIVKAEFAWIFANDNIENSDSLALDFDSLGS